MKRPWFCLGFVAASAAGVLFAGCATAPSGKGAAPVPGSPSPARREVGASAGKSAPASSLLRADQLAVRIESIPVGALIVVGEQVLGRAPVTAVVSATPQGFFAGTVTVRARFLATDAQHESVSVQQEFTHLDRIPASVVFGPDGARRIAR